MKSEIDRGGREGEREERGHGLYYLIVIIFYLQKTYFSIFLIVDRWINHRTPASYGACGTVGSTCGHPTGGSGYASATQYSYAPAYGFIKRNISWEGWSPVNA